MDKHGKARQVAHGNIIWRIRIASWITKYRNTLRIYNTYCISTTTIVTRTRLNVILYVYFLSYRNLPTPRATKLVQHRLTTTYRARQKGRKCKWITAHRASANHIQEATAAEPVKVVIGQVFGSKYGTDVSRCNIGRSRLETLAKQRNNRWEEGGCRLPKQSTAEFQVSSSVSCTKAELNGKE